jgi:hypothetical protein
MAGRGWAASRGAGEGVTDVGQDADAVLAGGAEVAADGVAVPGGLLGAEPPGYLLLRLRGPQVPLGLVGGGRDPQVIDEAEHVVLPVAQALQQVAEGLLLAAGNVGHFGQADQGRRA